MRFIHPTSEAEAWGTGADRRFGATARTGASPASVTGGRRSPSFICDTSALCRYSPGPAAVLTLPEDVSFDVPGNPAERHPTWKHVDAPCG